MMISVVSFCVGNELSWTKTRVLGIPDVRVTSRDWLKSVTKSDFDLSYRPKTKTM